MSKPIKLILFVDDDEDDCEMVLEVVTEFYPDVKVAYSRNGQEALSFLNEIKQPELLPCLILLDIDMPIMDGKETLINIKKNAEFLKIPVVVLTTSSNLDDRLFFDQLAVEVVTKPPRLKDFQKIIQQIVSSLC